MDAVTNENKCPSCGGETAQVESPYCPSCGEPLSIPKTLAQGRFILNRAIGRGGMGRVFLATDTRLSAERAIKLLDLPDDLPPEQRNILRGRLIQEARASLALSDHTHHVVRVFDVGETDTGLPYLVMEYLEGRTLADALDPGPMQVRRALAIADQIASALAHAHGRGMVHRDLKPDNIMLVARDGTEDFVKLLDFGLVKMEDAEVQTQTGMAIGTLQYMAPEQLRGHSADSRNDVFAFGCILYEMLSGVRANPGSSQPELFAVLLDAGVEPLDTHRSDLSPELTDLVNQCVNLSPDARPNDGATLIRMLSELPGSAAEGPIAEVAVPLPTPRLDAPIGEGSSNRRGRHLLLGAVALCAALVALLLFLRPPTTREAPESIAAKTLTKPPVNGPALRQAKTDAESTKTGVRHKIPPPNDSTRPTPSALDDLPSKPAYRSSAGPGGWTYSGPSDDDAFAGFVIDLVFGPQAPKRTQRWAALHPSVRYWFSLHFESRRPTDGMAKITVPFPVVNRLRKRLSGPFILRAVGSIWTSTVHETIFETVNCRQLRPGDKLVTARWSMRGYAKGKCGGVACVKSLAQILKKGIRAGERVTLNLSVDRSEAESGKTRTVVADCHILP